MRKLATILVLASVTAGCATPVTQAPYMDRAELEAERQQHILLASQEKLEKQEAETKRVIEHQERLLKVSAPISRAAIDLCAKLIDRTNPCVYEFELVNKDELNAYADGKKIFITPSMMNFAGTDEELALVLGHELAHNMMNHISSTQKNVMVGALAGALVDALAASQGYDTGAGFTKGGAQIGQLRYSSAFEAEADYVGLYITSLAGYDISQAPGFWRKMSVRNPKAVYVASTHPSNPARSVALMKTIEEIENKKRQGIQLVPEMQQQNVAKQ
jgi:predicted Zn-dependent protease